MLRRFSTRLPSSRLPTRVRIYRILLTRLTVSDNARQLATTRSATNSASPHKPVETATTNTDDKDSNEAETNPQGDMEKKFAISHVVGGKGKITKGKRKKAAPKQKKRQARTQQTWKVENINSIRRAHDYTPENKRWQFAVKWVGYDARSWHYAETLGNYPLLCEQLANAIDSESIFTFPQQEEGESEGAEVDESLPDACAEVEVELGEALEE